MFGIRIADSCRLPCLSNYDDLRRPSSGRSRREVPNNAALRSAMRRFALFLLFVFAVALLPAQNDYNTYPFGPDSQPQPGVPKGAVAHYVLKPGRFYPGTPHNYAIYVPAQYDASKPAPFMIFLDGSQALGNSMRVPIVFDNLIARHEIPPMIGIFVDPGLLPALSDNDQNRYNRI